MLFIIIVFDYVFTPSSPGLFAGFILISTKGQSRDETTRLGIFVILQCTSFRVHVISFRLLLLRLCNSRCAEVLVKIKCSIESPWLRFMKAKLLK